MKQELTKPSSLRAISMLAVFTFLFLSTEYFYVNQIAQNASSARTVNVQNYALGISAIGFCLYPLLFRFFRDRLHSAVFFTLTMLAIVCFVILGSPVPPGLLTAVGMLLFLVLGILGSAVHYHFLCEISDKKYFARMVGISYGFAILLVSAPEGKPQLPDAGHCKFQPSGVRCDKSLSTYVRHVSLRLFRQHRPTA